MTFFTIILHKSVLCLCKYNCMYMLASLLPFSLFIVHLPLRDKIATGSFDKTCKLWSADTGKCFHTYRGHTAEIVSNIEI